MLELIEINPEKAPQMTVIWLHGLGADGHDFEGVVPFLNIPSHCQIRFIFPHAPYRNITVNMGMRMRAWYDILNPVLGLPGEDQSGIEQSCAQIAQIIDKEKTNGVEAGQIVLAGFSQGGAIALHLGLRYHKSLAGILALSTYMPLLESVHTELFVANQNTPILYLHGQADPVIPIVTAERSRQKLHECGCNLTTKDYPVAHSVSPDEILDIGTWLTERCELVCQSFGSDRSIDKAAS